MFVGRNFQKSLLLEFEKSEISLSSFNGVISLIYLMAQSCAFPCRCFLAFWIAWKWSNHLCILLFSLSRQASTLVGSSLGNSEQALRTLNPCHLQYTSNLRLLSNSIDDNGSFVVKTIVVVSVLSCLSLPIMICPTVPRFA